MSERISFRIVDWHRYAPPKSEARKIKGWHVLRREVFERDNFTCSYCGAKDVPLHCDHMHPFSRGGPSVLWNLATACGPCNSAKRDKTPAEWMPDRWEEVPEGEM